MKKSLQKVLFLFIAIIIFSTGCEDDPVTTDNKNGSPSNSVEAGVHQLINVHRTGMGLAALEWNETIAAECRNHSIEMAMHIQLITRDLTKELIK